MYQTIREFVSALEAAGELKRVTAPVSPILEITEIADRMSKSQAPFHGSQASRANDPRYHDRGGYALLFDRVEGSDIPLLINAFGSYRRMEFALGCNGRRARHRRRVHLRGGFDGIATSSPTSSSPSPPPHSAKASRAQKVRPPRPHRPQTRAQRAVPADHLPRHERRSQHPAHHPLLAPRRGLRGAGLPRGHQQQHPGRRDGQRGHPRAVRDPRGHLHRPRRRRQQHLPGQAEHRHLPRAAARHAHHVHALAHAPRRRFALALVEEAGPADARRHRAGGRVRPALRLHRARSRPGSPRSSWPASSTARASPSREA